jgi:hypothetical protein
MVKCPAFTLDPVASDVSQLPRERLRARPLGPRDVVAAQSSDKSAYRAVAQTQAIAPARIDAGRVSPTREPRAQAQLMPGEAPTGPEGARHR